MAARKKSAEAAPAGKPEPHYKGHRQRLRERFEDTGDEALPDYELLELILFQAIPQGDTKPAAKALLARFKSFSGVLAASRHELLKVPGVGPAVVHSLKLTLASAKRFARNALPERPLLGSWSAVIEYCHVNMAHEAVEQFRILFLDKKNQLIADEVQQTGTVDHTPVYPREVVKRALELSASAIILVHNHPSGDPTPSSADIDMTKTIVEIAKPLGIQVHDHLIVGRSGHVSLRALQLM